MVKKKISISDILVNQENPRFNSVKTEQKAIDLMMNEVGDKVFNLAKDIAEHGLNPSKSLMVVEVDGGKFLPLEGNRRIVALKLLHKPDMTTNVGFKDKFLQLIKDAGISFPEEVDCVIFPEKESAYRWVSLEHTGQNNGVGVVGWDSEQKARFIAQYSGKKLSRSVQLIDYVKENKISDAKVDLTTLENRILGNPSTRKMLGIDFPNGILKIVKSMQEVNSNLRELFTAMSSESFKVSDVYTSAKTRDWLAKVLGLEDNSKEEQKEKKSKEKTKKSDPLDGEWITPKLYSVYAPNNRVKVILKELKGLNPKTRPNICATSLRVLLELALYVFLSEKGHLKIIIEKERERFIEENRKKSKKRVWNKDWAPNFRKTIDFLSNEESLIPKPSERKALKTFIVKKSSEAFLDELNQFIHNPDYDATPAAVTEIWSKLGKIIFRAILSTQE